MFELSLMLNTAGLYWFGVALVWFGLIREGSYELHVIVVKASLYVGNDPAKTKSQLLYTQVAQVLIFMSGVSTTRKRKVLSLEQKLEVCRQVESGESFRKIAKSFGVGLQTISDMTQTINASITNIHFKKLKTSDYSKDAEKLCVWIIGVPLYEEGRQEKVKSRSITNDKKMNIHMPSINV
ncbi:hypothetical protein T4C_4783 [Trichinella pseudospiralis]|uniref:HTH psq-type domain-containing protein n=1 Tax=Trichinella pseudospiralis TaxID=6337 RepID=A0A0V1JYJ8_TRIPS|nr:hypothetical protein T4C_4783 [Trichinella pseudospiralis]